MTTGSDTASALVRTGYGILAADESISTMSARLTRVGVVGSEHNRRAYREMLVTTPGLSDGISGVILCDETLRQSVSDGRFFPQVLGDLGLLTGIKVDAGTTPLAGSPGETITEGLDGLRARLADYVELGASFAKWRAVISMRDGAPTTPALVANAHALARYAALCQEAGVVPIVEPEVLMDGRHGLEECAAVTSATLRAVFDALATFRVRLDGIVLKPNMVINGLDSAESVDAADVAEASVFTLRAAVPDSVAGVAFLSGGQGAARASENLAAMQDHPTPWPLTFSFGRALVDDALTAWHGDPDRVEQGQAALAHRVGCNTAALAGTYNPAMELGASLVE